MQAINGEGALTVAEAAELLGINEQTVRIWLREGKLRGRYHLDSPRLGWRVPSSEVRRLLEGEPDGGD